MRIPLDSSANIFLLRGNTKAAELVSGAVEILFPVIVIGKLLYGFRLGTHFTFLEGYAPVPNSILDIQKVANTNDDTLAKRRPGLGPAYLKTADLWGNE